MKLQDRDIVIKAKRLHDNYFYVEHSSYGGMYQKSLGWLTRAQMKRTGRLLIKAAKALKTPRRRR